MALARYPQNEFSGGQDSLSDETKISLDSYEWLLNGRSRFSCIETIKKPLELSTAPSGLKQGLYSLGDTLILFVVGLAYYYDSTFNVWQQIAGFSMDSDVDIIYAEAVNASTANYLRKLNISRNINDKISKLHDFTIAGNPAGLVCQDGINQPWLIQLNQLTNILTARLTKTYSQWSNTSMTADDREYVPIGKQMKYINDILFVVSPNGDYVMRSVTGRPLDFMVNVDVDGNKLITELQGGAKSISFAIDFDQITAISDMGSDSFIIATATNVRIVQFDYTNTLFGEPTFTYPTTLKFGIVNQFCVSQFKDVIGIDFEGIISFNAVSQLKFEGRNSRFSLLISKFLNKIRQDVCCCIEFDNYIHFAVKTTLGYVVFIYDHLIDTWTGIDVTAANRIKMFAITSTDDSSILYCITDEKVFQYYGSETTAPCSLKIRSVERETLSEEHSSNELRLVFEGCNEAGVCIAIEQVDGNRYGANVTGKVSIQRDIPISDLGINYPVIAPVMPDNDASIVQLVFPFKDGITGRRISYIITWNNPAKLKEIEIATESTTRAVSQRQSSKTFN